MSANDNDHKPTYITAWQTSSTSLGDDATAVKALRGGAGRRALVVDDNRDGADSLAMLLEIMGIKVKVAYGGEAALAALADFDAQIAFLDIAMPQVDGYEVARRIRAMQPARKILLVAMTGWSTTTLDEGRGLEDFDAHVLKPVSTSALSEMLSALPEA